MNEYEVIYGDGRPRGFWKRLIWRLKGKPIQVIYTFSPEEIDSMRPFTIVDGAIEILKETQ